MNYKMIGRFLAQILLLEAGFMIPALLISAADGDAVVLRSFVETTLLLLAVSGFLLLLCRHGRRGFFGRGRAVNGLQGVEGRAGRVGAHVGRGHCLPRGAGRRTRRVVLAHLARGGVGVL